MTYQYDDTGDNDLMGADEAFMNREYSEPTGSVIVDTTEDLF